MSIDFVYFGTPELSAQILEHLKGAGLLPALIVTNPDRPQGRNMIVTPPPVKVWATKNSIPYLQPETLSDTNFVGQLSKVSFQLFIVVAYGKIIPQLILDLPEKGTLNIHYSLLPKYRGASPMESAILKDDKDVGVTIMLMDSKMDHGPVIASRRLENNELGITNKEWPMKASELRKTCNELGAKLLIETIPKWIDGKIEAVPQEHSNATYTKKFEKTDGEIDLSGDAYQNFLKIQAFEDSIGTYFFMKKNDKMIRAVIKEAFFKDNLLKITRVVPEGKKEIDYQDFIRGFMEKK